MRVLTSKEMALADEKTINETGIPSLVLMESAGRGVVNVIDKKYPEAHSFLVVAGSGNNGGDALVVARYLYRAGKQVKVIVLAKDETKLSPDNKANLEILKKLRVEPIFITEENLHLIEDFLKDSEVVVDGIFGTGFKPPVRGYRAEAIRLINNYEKPIVAVDIPSGLSTDTGEIEGDFIKASTTITFAYPKLGHILYPAAQFCGDVYVVDISIDDRYVSDIYRFVLQPKDLHLPKREKDSHKYTYGHNLVIGGSVGKSGAVIMASKASTRAGVGLTTAFVPECINQTIESTLIEEMSIPAPCEDGLFSEGAANLLEEVVNNGKFSSLTVGMGMSVSDGTISLIEKVLSLNLPKVIDADGINSLVKLENFKERLKKSPSPIILTPHIGEFSRLTGISSTEIKKNPEVFAKEFVKETGVYLVLKFSRTLIVFPDGEVFYSIRGNEGMAKAGTGDVLAGILGALINRLPMKEALKTGVYLHGLCGDLVVEKTGVESLKATDLIEVIPEAYRWIKEHKDENYSLIKKLQ